MFLVTSLVAGAALSLYWIDFYLYLSALGFSNATIGAIATVASLVAAALAFPASAASDRFGRRAVMAGGLGLSLVALVGLLASEALPAIVLFAALWAVGQQAFQVVVAPYLAEHSDTDHRNELFAAQFAIYSVTNVIAAVVGGLVAVTIAGQLGFDPEGPGTYRVVLVIMSVLLAAALVTVAFLSDDRPRTALPRDLREAGEPARFPRDPRRPRARFGLVARDRRRVLRLVFPGFLISIGAGQVIPFLNLFIQGKFGLDLATLNGVFALTSVGTFIAILAQPVLARRLGQIGSVVMVQAASIPFVVILGFSPVLWTVIAAMMVRNSLMNASNPIFTAFAMEQVTSAERATLSAAMTVLWSAGWVIGGTMYAVAQATLGFEAGYALNFLALIALYSTAAFLYWTWFRPDDRRARVAHTAS
jgi:MFS family permease